MNDLRKSIVTLETDRRVEKEELEHAIQVKDDSMTGLKDKYKTEAQEQKDIISTMKKEHKANLANVKKKAKEDEKVSSFTPIGK